MTAPTRFLLAPLLLASALALAPGCSKTSTPTEPPRPLPDLGLSLLPAAAGDQPGTLTLEGHFCPCARGPVTVTIGNKEAGTLGCGETRAFPADSLPVRLQLSSPEIAPFNGVVGTLDVGGPPAIFGGMRAGIWCAVPAG